MQDNTHHQAAPGDKAKREFSRVVDSINAGILAAGGLRPKWTQEEAIAYECALECISDLRAILTGERHDNPTPERLAEIEAEFSRLGAERRALSVHDHAEIARIRSSYGRRIRYHRMGEEQARGHLAALGLAFAAEGARLDGDTWRALGILAFEVIECVSDERPAEAEAGAWLHITEHYSKPDASGLLFTVAVQRPYWIRKADLPRLQELESRLAAAAGKGAAWTA